VRFWDSSAVVALIVEEESSREAEGVLAEDAEMVAWWGTLVECTSALARRERAAAIDPAAAARALFDLGELARSWTEIAPVESVREDALRLLRVHELRAGDALQLAAAIAAAENRPDALDVVTLDDRLALAARHEGFRVLPS
jgi:predicted nucleic acid-binding protein